MGIALDMEPAPGREIFLRMLLRWLLGSVLAVGGTALLWACCGDGLLDAAYHGRSLGLFNAMIKGQADKSLGYYQQEARSLLLSLDAALMLGLALAQCCRAARREDSSPAVFRAFLVAVGLTLVGTMLLARPVVYGDGEEYLLMAESLANHGSPDLRPGDIQSLATRLQGTGAVLAPPTDGHPYGYYRARDGRLYSYHFWAYPLACLPVKMALRLLRVNEIKALPLTNAALLLIALHQVLLSSRALSPARRTVLAALVLASPVLWFVHWTHPEVLSSALVVLALIALHEGRWPAATLFAAAPRCTIPRCSCSWGTASFAGRCGRAATRGASASSRSPRRRRRPPLRSIIRASGFPASLPRSPPARQTFPGSR